MTRLTCLPLRPRYLLGMSDIHIIGGASRERSGVASGRGGMPRRPARDAAAAETEAHTGEVWPSSFVPIRSVPTTGRTRGRIAARGNAAPGFAHHAGGGYPQIARRRRLAVDRAGFSDAVQAALTSHPEWTIEREEVPDPPLAWDSVIIATGP